MKFIKYPEVNNEWAPRSYDNSWWEWDTDRMRAYNIHGGWHNINENLLGDCECIECDSWHDLHQKTGFNPLVSAEFTRTGWISPEGEFYPCEAHECDAETIYELIYGEEHCYYSDKMIELGWIKVTTSLMFDIYVNQGLYLEPHSREAERTFARWCDEYGMEP